MGGWKIEDIGSNVNRQLQNKANGFEWFSLAPKPDVTHSAQLLFIWRVNADFKVTEKLASVNSLHEQLQARIFSKKWENSIVQPKWTDRMCYNWY